MAEKKIFAILGNDKIIKYVSITISIIEEYNFNKMHETFKRNECLRIEHCTKIIENQTI